MSFLFSAFGVVLALYIGVRILVFLLNIIIKILSWITFANICRTIGGLAIGAIVVMVLMRLFPY